MNVKRKITQDVATGLSAAGEQNGCGVVLIGLGCVINV